MGSKRHVADTIKSIGERQSGQLKGLAHEIRSHREIRVDLQDRKLMLGWAQTLEGLSDEWTLAVNITDPKPRSSRLLAVAKATGGVGAATIMFFGLANGAHDFEENYGHLPEKMRGHLVAIADDSDAIVERLSEGQPDAEPPAESDGDRAELKEEAIDSAARRLVRAATEDGVLQQLGFFVYELRDSTLSVTITDEEVYVADGKVIVSVQNPDNLSSRDEESVSARLLAVLGEGSGLGEEPF